MLSSGSLVPWHRPACAWKKGNLCLCTEASWSCAHSEQDAFPACRGCPLRGTLACGVRGDNHQISPTICKAYSPPPGPCSSPCLSSPVALFESTHPGSPDSMDPSSRKSSLMSSVYQPVFHPAVCFHFWVLFLLFLPLSPSLHLFALSCLFLSFSLCPDVSPFLSFPTVVSVSLYVCYSLSSSPSLLPPLLLLSPCVLGLFFCLSVSVSVSPLSVCLSPNCLSRGSVCLPLIFPLLPPFLIYAASADEMGHVFLQRAGQRTAVSAGGSC